MPFKKGETGNRKGRPKKGHGQIDDLERALALAKKDDGSNFDVFEHFIERAKTNDAVLISLIKKLKPDLKQSEINATVVGAVGIGTIPDALKELMNGNKD